MAALLALDFDCTLASREINFDADLWASMLESGFGGADRVQALDALFSELSDTHGVELAIVSYNSSAVIRKALRAVGLARHFPPERVFGSDAFVTTSSLRNSPVSPVAPGRWRKDILIQQLLLSPLGLSADGLLFVDDDASHIDDVAQTLPSAQTLLLTPDGESETAQGIQGAQMEAIRRWAAGDEPDSPREVMSDRLSHLSVQQVSDRLSHLGSSSEDAGFQSAREQWYRIFGGSGDKCCGTAFRDSATAVHEWMQTPRACLTPRQRQGAFSSCFPAEAGVVERWASLLRDSSTRVAT